MDAFTFGLILGVAAGVLGLRSSIRRARLSLVQSPASTPPAPLNELRIPGSEPGPRAPAFLRKYGIQPAAVLDVRKFQGDDRTLEELPAAIQDALSFVYTSGTGQGAELMEIVSHARPLKRGEAAYFVLLAPDTPAAQRIGTVVGFVGHDYRVAPLSIKRQPL